jgi:hypothetical protein
MEVAGLGMGIGMGDGGWGMGDGGQGISGMDGDREMRERIPIYRAIVDLVLVTH